MTDKSNSSDSGAEDSKGEQLDGQPAQKSEDESKSNVDPAEKARRDQQSKKDKAIAEKDETTERLNFLESRENKRMRDEFVSDLLTKEKDKYPNVDPNDPMFKYATSEEEVEEIAVSLQNKYKDIQQKALSDVQIESDKGLTDEEIAEAEKELETEVEKTGQSRFGSFFSNVSRRKKV